MNNSVINLVLYHDFLYNIKKHKADDAVGIIREYVAGDQIMRAKDTGSLHTKVLDLKEDMAIMGVEEYVIEEYYGEQGNICFFTKHEVAGAEVIGIPVRFGEGVRAMLLPDSLDPDYNVVLVNESDVATHFKKLSENEDAEFVAYLHNILKTIPKDTLLKFIEPEKYQNTVKTVFGDEDTDFPEDSYKSGFGMYIKGDEGNREVAHGLFYDALAPEVAGKQLNDAENELALVCCKNENFREFFVVDSEFVRNTDNIEEYYLVNIDGIARQIDVLLAESNVAREVRKATTDKANAEVIARDVSKAVDTDRGGAKAAALPISFTRKVKEINSRMRQFISNWRRAHDDDLREKLYNDEYIPLIDDIFEILISGASTYGAIALGLTGPVGAAIIGLGVFIFANWRQKEDRKRILELLDDKIKLLGEEIEDAKYDNDLVTKRQLMQIKTQLERKRAKITVGRSLGSR